MLTALTWLVAVVLTLMVNDVILAEKTYDCDVNRYTPHLAITDIPSLLGGKEMGYVVTAMSNARAKRNSTAYGHARELAHNWWEFKYVLYFNDTCRVIMLQEFVFSYPRQRLESPVVQVGNTSVWFFLYILAGDKEDGFLMYTQRWENGTVNHARSAYTLSTRFKNHDVDLMIAKPALDIICNEDVDVNQFFNKIEANPDVDGTCVGSH